MIVLFINLPLNMTNNLYYNSGAVVMDVDLKAQLPASEQSTLVTLYRTLISTYTNASGSGFLDLSPMNYIRRIRTSRLVDSALKTIIVEKYTAATASNDVSAVKPVEHVNGAAKAATKPRSVLALSLIDTEHLTPLIVQQTADQLKSFLFAGHDTTSILLQQAFYHLSLSPHSLSALLTEHVSIFGAHASPEHISSVLLNNGEEVLSRMSYASAVVKETLRLYPPAGSARRVSPGGGFFITLPDGKSLCLDGMVLYNMHYYIQRDPAVYGDDAEVFRPDRWLGDVGTHAESEDASGEERAIPPSSWRPFERGPRNCIGQELANLEARVILALVVGRYCFEKVGVGRVKVEDGKPVVDEKTGEFVVESELFNVSVVVVVVVEALRQ